MSPIVYEYGKSTTKVIEALYLTAKVEYVQVVVLDTTSFLGWILNIISLPNSHLALILSL